MPIAEAALITFLLLTVPQAAVSHVGHGDEFQATGGVERVRVNPETDPMLGILVEPIAPADGSSAVLVPATALVDVEGKQFVFVQYENFYEPVEVTTGATQGNLIEVTQGLSVGENLVSQGSLSLYAESRKTQTSNTATNPSPIISPKADATHAQADAQGIVHDHDAAGNMVAQQPGEDSQQLAEAAQQSRKFPLGLAAAGGVVVLVSAIALFGSQKKRGIFSNRKGGM